MDQQNRLQMFEKRKSELQNLTDDQLKTRFWDLCQKVVNPLVKLGRDNTSPSIERSVLLRMGIDSLTSKAVVNHITEMGLLGHGAGNIILKIALREKIGVRNAAQRVAEKKELLEGVFEGKKDA